MLLDSDLRFRDPCLRHGKGLRKARELHAMGLQHVDGLRGGTCVGLPPPEWSSGNETFAEIGMCLGLVGPFDCLSANAARNEANKQADLHFGQPADGSAHNAFRHMLWVALTVIRTGSERSADTISYLHEFVQPHPLEDHNQMDSANNWYGRKIGSRVLDRYPASPDGYISQRSRYQRVQNAIGRIRAFVEKGYGCSLQWTDGVDFGNGQIIHAGWNGDFTDRSRCGYSESWLLPR